MSSDFLRTMMTLIGEGDLYAPQSSTQTPSTSNTTPATAPPSPTQPQTTTPTAPPTPPKDHVIEKVPEQAIPETPTLVPYASFNPIT